MVKRLFFTSGILSYCLVDPTGENGNDLLPYIRLAKDVLFLIKLMIKIYIVFG